MSDAQTYLNQFNAATNRTLVSGNFATQSASASASNLNYPVVGPTTNEGFIGAETSLTGVSNLSSTVVIAETQITAAAAANNPALITGQTPIATTFTLTPNPDTFGDAASLNQQVFNASPGTFTPFDDLTGGLSGIDTLNVTNTGGAYTNPLSITVNGVERVNLTSTGGAATITTAAGSGFTGVTALNVNTSGGAQSVTAASNTAITSTNTLTAADAFLTTINGGSSVTASVVGAGNATLTVGILTDRDLNVGGTTAPTGAVNVTYNASNLTSAAGAVIGGNTFVTGGTTVTVNSLGTNASNAANTATLGAVTVTGTANTTSVTVNQSIAQTQAASAAAVAGASNAVAARNSIVNGNVVVNDATAGSTTAAGTITSVTLNNLGGGATAAIASNALTTLSLSNPASIVPGVTASGAITLSYARTVGSPTTLALNLGGGLFGTLATNGGAVNAISTINTTMTGDTTLAGITDTALRTLNLSGTGVLTLTAMNTAVTALTSAGASGINANLSANNGLTAISMGGTGNNTVTINSQLQSYSGGGGNDRVTIVNDPLKAISGGLGSDTIVLNAAAGTFTGANTTAFISGFENLGLNTGSSGTYNLSTFGLTGVTGITLLGSVGAATVATNVTAGTALNINAAQGNGFTYQLAGTSGPSSSVNVNVNIDAGSSGLGTLVFQDSLANGIGTINIAANNTIGNSVDTITTLTSSQLNTLNLSGNAAVSVTNAITTGATSFTLSNTSTSTGASTLGGITGNSIGALNYSGTHDTTITTFADTAAIITIANANTGTTAGTGVLTIGGHTANTITSLSLNGAVAYTGTSTSTNAAALSGATNDAAVSITWGGATGVKTIVLGNGANTIVTGGADDVITVGTGGNTITGAAGGDTITFGAGSASSQAVYSAIAETFNAAVTSGTTALTAAAGADIYSGLQAGDTISLAGISNTYTGAVTTTLNAADQTTVGIVRGNWNATTGVFTTSATGSDSLLQFDETPGSAGGVIDTAVLVGFVNTASTAAAGVLTLA